MKKFITNNKDKKILILGFGREGQSTYSHLRKYLPQSTIGIADKTAYDKLDGDIKNKLRKDKNISLHFGTGHLKALKKYNLIIKSPGIPNKLKEIKDAKAKGIEFTSQTKIFFEECKGIIVGVTGTKGKSTTTTLIYHILITAGEEAVMLGNIGKPPLDYLKNNKAKTINVFEMSSHQLSDMTESPDIAVLLNIFPEHLDYYENFDDYFNAKKNITKFQRSEDYFIYNFDDKNLRRIVKETKAETLAFSRSFQKEAYLKQDSILVRSGKNIIKVLSKNDIKLKGIHNLNNIMASVLAARVLGVSVKAIKKGVKTFNSLPVRLEEIGIYRNILFVLDALATIPEATIAAIETYKGNVGTLICGGFDRGQNYKEFAKEIIKNKVQNLVLFPTTGERIWNEIESLKLKQHKLPNHVFVNNMDDAVKTCYEVTEKGKVCLLSAASSSFSVFKNYEEESKLFREAVKKYSKTKND